MILILVSDSGFLDVRTAATSKFDGLEVRRLTINLVTLLIYIVIDLVLMQHTKPT